jgi:4-hydroxy-4-methyl-2-oxoglutarate aldolase
MNLRSADVADAAEKVTGRRCHMSSAIRLIEGGAVAGPAVTLHFVRDDNTAAAALGMAVVRFIQSAPAGSVLVAALDDGADFAAFGAGLGMLAKVRGIAGIVVDGAVRDRPELRKMSLPTFARGTASGSAGGRYRLAAINEPVLCGGIEVRPGDLVVGDEDGVAVAPGGRAEEIAAMAEKLEAEERELVARLSSPP